MLHWVVGKRMELGMGMRGNIRLASLWRMGWRSCWYCCTMDSREVPCTALVMSVPWSLSMTVSCAAFRRRIRPGPCKPRHSYSRLLLSFLFTNSPPVLLIDTFSMVWAIVTPLHTLRIDGSHRDDLHQYMACRRCIRMSKLDAQACVKGDIHSPLSFILWPR
jgi:hypothetical protein